jgi:hypothetical protein
MICLKERTGLLMKAKKRFFTWKNLCARDWTAPKIIGGEGEQM